MTSEQTITEKYKVTQIGEELSSVEAALRAFIPADLEEKLLASIPKWFLLVDLFKKLELPYARLADRSTVEPRYRAVLTSLMGFGENIEAGLQARSCKDLSAIKTTRETIFFNVCYLRDKYEQWFISRDSAGVAETLQVIQNARATSPQPDSGR